MGLGIQLAELIVTEHLHRPLPPVVHTIGRLYTGMQFDSALRLIKQYGIKPRDVEPELDTFTNEARRSEQPSITDSCFLKLLGAQEVLAIDISPYEGAAIVWDLCKPIPDQFANRAEFIVGGSTLDNVFDAGQYIRNIARMLRPKGRLFEINSTNNHYRPYVMLPAAWYFDYFVVNGFDDCKTYMLEYSNAPHLFRLFAEPNPKQQVGWGLIDNFIADDSVPVNVVVFAEKGDQSTWNEIPVQDAWRDAERVAQYNE